jgi:catechol 2,3-dioxygenase-like lactoylglutathione lyase family enzyme
MKLAEIAFFTNNVAGMAAFYQKFLGAGPVAESPDMAIFMIGHTKIFIHKTYSPGEGDLPPENHMAFTVEDVDATCLALKAQGLTVEIEPHDYYWGRSAYLRDSDGHLIELTREQP